MCRKERAKGSPWEAGSTRSRNAGVSGNSQAHGTAACVHVSFHTRPHAHTTRTGVCAHEHAHPCARSGNEAAALWPLCEPQGRPHRQSSRTLTWNPNHARRPVLLCTLQRSCQWQARTRRLLLRVLERPQTRPQTRETLRRNGTQSACEKVHEKLSGVRLHCWSNE